MSSNPLFQVANFGQSIWLDQMRRSLLSSGESKKLIDNDGLRGLTSNPTIFEKAIGGSSDYVEQLSGLAQKGATISECMRRSLLRISGVQPIVFRQPRCL